MAFQSVVLLAARLMEGAGVGVMMLGALLAASRLFTRRGTSYIYRRLRLDLGRAILLGLEFLVAADILRTVSDQPTLNDVLVLGLIVLIRTFLSFTLEVELEGRWPWQQAREPASGAVTPRDPSATSPPVEARESEEEERSVPH
ncbi:DUF1622 domain-containing protein [Corallococcus llansteffanensis]|uniref:DUF1622 domain-containing protein n=1 Tax=Corallococcus llansteffanensis TaxID=2316731 RepID=A0A3A8NVC9_9BACT|nr:DUF1622 domain-containing protein [Corallococcus llansteffanensis]RKH44002.1 DUF1622 domain-containing protein [Corallococcus llansteffanensis]